VSSFASFGLATDENTVWDTKLQEVQTILRQVVKAVFCMFLDHPDPDPSLFVWIRILLSSSKIVRKAVISTVL
jgi:hypothetical protein